MKRDDHARLQIAIGKYLEKRGWRVVVAGGTGVRQSVGARNFNYEFVMPFTGGKIVGKDKKT